MLRQPHHQRILKILQALDAARLSATECFFGGGTAIVLLLDEYRVSEDVDFLCAVADGYRTLRNLVYDHGVQGLFTETVTLLREPRVDRYGIRARLLVEEVVVKFEIISEGRISLSGETVDSLPVRVLCRTDLMAEKLLANTDRYNDTAIASRDILDLAMMIEAWGAIPDEAWQKAKAAYGESAVKAFHRSVELINQSDHLQYCLARLQFDPHRTTNLVPILNQERARL